MSDDSFPHPLFILGSARSFTSLICAMVGQHPALYGVPELNLFVSDRLDRFLEEMTGYRQIQLHGLIRTVAHVYSGEQSLASMDMARRWMIPQLESSTGDVYRTLCARVAPLRIVDKSPAYAVNPKNLLRAQAAFPNAYWLHLVRNPRSQGESIMKLNGGIMAILANSIDYHTDTPTVDPQISWLQMQKNILEFFATVPRERTMCMRGEDFLNQRDESLRKICAWLGISSDESCLDEMMHPERSPFARLGPIGAHLGNDINFLRSPALRTGTIKDPPLEGVLPWRDDGQGFSEEVLGLARDFGYH